MRESGYQAGMGSPEHPDQLLIALEPEAASIYCRRLRLHQLMPKNDLTSRSQSLKYNLNKPDTEVNNYDVNKKKSTLPGIGRDGNTSDSFQYLNHGNTPVDDWFNKGQI